ncbi:hypothetical protein [Nocardia heshunensis]
MKRTVVAFLRREISGNHELDDYVQIVAVAERLGGVVTLVKYGGADEDRDTLLVRLMNLVYNERADILVIPSREHLAAEEVRELLKWTQVVDADTGEYFAPAAADGCQRPRLLVIREDASGGRPRS